jgi:hypothetical protein
MVGSAQPYQLRYTAPSQEFAVRGPLLYRPTPDLALGALSRGPFRRVRSTACRSAIPSLVWRLAPLPTATASPSRAHTRASAEVAP